MPDNSRHSREKLSYPPKVARSQAIKLGIDAHAKYYWASRQGDGATSQPVQKMTCEELMLFVVKQQKLTRNMVTCYDAGAFGFHLYRLFDELGIKNYVVQPQDWDERGKGVKNDRLDAAALCQRLNRDELVGKNAFSTVRTPTVDQERGRVLLALHNIHAQGSGARPTAVRCARSAKFRQRAIF